MIDETRWVVPAAPNPLLRTLVAFPIALFTGALATDIVYVGTANMLWADFSAWLLAAGEAMGVLAALVGIVDLITHRRARRARQSVVLMLCGLLVLAVAFVDNLMHSRDAWTSVMPYGLALSAAVVVLILITIWAGAALAPRQEVVTPYPATRS